MGPLSPEAKFRWNLAIFITFLFLAVADIFTLLRSPPTWFSQFPHWTWRDFSTFCGDLFFPMMALFTFSDLRKSKRARGNLGAATAPVRRRSAWIPAPHDPDSGQHSVAAALGDQQQCLGRRAPTRRQA